MANISVLSTLQVHSSIQVDSQIQKGDQQASTSVIVFVQSQLYICRLEVKGTSAAKAGQRGGSCDLQLLHVSKLCMRSLIIHCKLTCATRGHTLRVMNMIICGRAFSYTDPVLNVPECLQSQGALSITPNQLLLPMKLAPVTSPSASAGWTLEASTMTQLGFSASLSCPFQTDGHGQQPLLGLKCIHLYPSWQDKGYSP